MKRKKPKKLTRAQKKVLRFLQDEDCRICGHLIYERNSINPIKTIREATVKALKDAGCLYFLGFELVAYPKETAADEFWNYV